MLEQTHIRRPMHATLLAFERFGRYACFSMRWVAAYMPPDGNLLSVERPLSRPHGIDSQGIEGSQDQKLPLDFLPLPLAKAKGCGGGGGREKNQASHPKLAVMDPPPLSWKCLFLPSINLKLPPLNSKKRRPQLCKSYEPLHPELLPRRGFDASNGYTHTHTFADKKTVLVKQQLGELGR